MRRSTSAASSSTKKPATRAEAGVTRKMLPAARPSASTTASSADSHGYGRAVRPDSQRCSATPATTSSASVMATIFNAAERNGAENVSPSAATASLSKNMSALSSPVPPDAR